MKKILYLLVLAFCIGCTDQPIEENEKQTTEEWVSIFNGKDLSGWKIKFRGHPLGTNYKNTFLVKDGVLKVSYDEYEGFDRDYGHIFYDKPFSNYHLRLEYRFTGDQVLGGPGWAYKNNGIMFHAQSPESMGLEQEFPVSLEAQLLGGKEEGERPTGNLCTPGTHVIMGDTLVTQHCISSTSKTYRGEEWIRAELIVYGDSIIHQIINGKEVLSYSKPIIGGAHLPEGYPLAEGSPLKSGYIALQAESHPTEFRKIELKELNRR